MSAFEIVPYSVDLRSDVIGLAIRAWTPVFEKTRGDVPGFVYDAFYPDGWDVRQAADVGALLDKDPDGVWVALDDRELAGFVGLRVHPEDRMGEVVIIAVAPERQRRGLGRALMDFAEERIRAAGMTMVMVETVGDAGHAPARRTYEALGYKLWPVARYFKPL